MAKEWRRVCGETARGMPASRAWRFRRAQKAWRVRGPRRRPTKRAGLSRPLRRAGPPINYMQRGKNHMRKAYFLGLALLVLIMTAGCGQKVKQENEALKAQVAALTGEKTTLATQLASATQELEEAKTRITTLTSELDATKQELEVLKTKPKAKKKARK